MRYFIIGALMLCALSGRASAGATDYFTELVKDFGVTPRGPVLTHYFTIHNTSKQTITLGTARVSCGCVSATILKSQLAPNETTSVVAMMDTRRIPQANTIKSVTVYVPFLAPVLEEVALRVQSIARDDLVISPESLAFGTVRKGKLSTSAVKLTLFNNTNWNITEVVSNGVYVKGSVKLANRTTTEVAYEIVATLDPECPVGNWTAEFTVKTNAPGIESLRIPVTVNVVAPIAISPDAVSLTNLKVGDSTEHRVLLQSTNPFRITKVNGGDAEVSIKTQEDEARPTQIVTLTVKPSKAGTLTRTIEILTDHKEMPMVALPFKATTLGAAANPMAAAAKGR